MTHTLIALNRAGFVGDSVIRFQGGELARHLEAFLGQPPTTVRPKGW